MLIALIMLYDFINSPKTEIKDQMFSAVYLIGALFLVITAVFSKKLRLDYQKHLVLLLFECLLISGGIIYYWTKSFLFITLAHAFLAGAILLFWIYLVQRRFGEKIIISVSHIILPSLFGTRQVDWKDLSNVVKKDELLTLDFKNNKLLQVEIVAAEGNENDFNEFCRQRLVSQN